MDKHTVSQVATFVAGSATTWETCPAKVVLQSKASICVWSPLDGSVANQKSLCIRNSNNAKYCNIWIWVKVEERVLHNNIDIHQEKLQHKIIIIMLSSW